MGIEEFFDPERKAGEPFVSGRSWTVVDLRRKDFDDLHKLWYVLYKERNLLLSLKAKYRRSGRPIAQLEDNRYIKVKRSMAAIKHVLGERQKIGNKIKELNSIIENENQNNDIQKK
jgi:large subunit ribosomal protein L47